MPYTVRYSPRKDGKNWAIVNKETGKVVGHSTSKEKAKSAARARMAGKHGWKGRKR